MDTTIVVALIGAAGAVAASVVSALLQRSRMGPPAVTPVREVPARPGGRVGTFRTRLAVGVSALVLVVGLSAALFAPGGWYSTADRKADGYELTWLTSLSERLGFKPWTHVPLTGLGVAVVAAVGLVVGWAAGAPRSDPTRR